MQITGVSSTPSNCSNSGSITIQVNGGTPVYCFQIIGNSCQFTVQPSYTFNSLSSGTYQISVSDANGLTVDTTIEVAGNYQEPFLYCQVNGCQISSIVNNGSPPFLYSISTNGSAFSSPQTDSIFNNIENGPYCVLVTDGCNNVTTYCGMVTTTILSLKVKCCDTPIPDSVCFRLTDSSNKLAFQPDFDPGGLPPYTITATSGATTININTGVPVLPAVCPVWTFNITDACGNMQSVSNSCLHLEPGCINCNEGTAQVVASNGTPPYTYYYLDNGNWIPNSPPQSGDFINLLPDSNGIISLKVIDACNDEEIAELPCLNMLGAYDCTTLNTIMTVNSQMLPATVTCFTCLPQQTFVVNDLNIPLIFSGASGLDSFLVTNICHDTLYSICQQLEPELSMVPSCNSLTALMNGVYACNGDSTTPFPVTDNVTYKLYNILNPNVILSTNTTGVFTGLTPGGTYIVSANNNICGMVADTATLISPMAFSLDLNYKITSFLDAAGNCVAGYIILPVEDSIGSVAISYELNGGPDNVALNGIDQFVNLKPGTYQLVSENFCADTTLVLPPVEFDLDIIFPICPNDGCIDLTGGKTTVTWDDWGDIWNMNILNVSDRYVLDCDPAVTNCPSSTNGQICNLDPGSVHIAYLKPQPGGCAVDTLIFTVPPVSNNYPDSVYFTRDYLCAEDTIGSISAFIYGGLAPYVIQELDADGNIVRYFYPDDSLSNNILLDSISFYTHFFRIVDGCNNSTDVTTSNVVSLLETEFSYVYNCNQTVFLYSTIFPDANYTWIKNSTGDTIDMGINHWSYLLPALPFDESYTLLIQYADCEPYQIDVTVPFIPVITVDVNSSSDVACVQTDSITLTALSNISNATYVWSNAAEYNIITLNQQSGIYTVTATDSNGCTATAQQSVYFDQLESDLISTDISCFGDSTGIIAVNIQQGESPYYYIWSDGDTSATRTMLPAGNYEVTITNISGCIDTLSINLEEPALFELSVAATDIVCHGDNSTVTISGSGGTQPYTGMGAFQWPAGVYSILVSDAHGCADSLELNITEPPLLEVAYIAPDITCYGDTTQVTITANGGVPPYSNTGVFEYTGGTYQVPVTDANGCIFELELILNEPPPYVIESFETIQAGCFGESNGAAQVVVSGGTPPYQYLWNTGSTNDLINNLSAGFYAVTITDNSLCQVSEAITITDYPLFQVQVFPTDPRCFDSGDGSIFIPVLTGGSNSGLTVNDLPFNGLWQMTQLSGGEYPLYIEDDFGCDTLIIAELAENQFFDIHAGDDVYIRLGESAMLTATQEGNPLLPATLEWTPANSLDCSDCYQTISTPSESTVYTVQLTDSTGCVVSDEVQVIVDRQCQLFLPNIFSPNDDNINDTWETVKNTCVAKFNYARIFDRWGELVFENQDIPENIDAIKWDGIFKGVKLPVGVYIALVEVTFIDGRTELFVQDITLVR